MSTKGKVVVIVALLLFLSAVIFLTPYLTVNNMKVAAASRDATTLAHYIDFPILRENVKATAATKLASVMGTGQTPSALSNFGSAMAGAFIDHMVDILITPESIAMMLTGQMPNDVVKKEDAASITADLDTSMGYEDMNQFAVSVKKKGTTNTPITFVLARENVVFWKLVGIRLP